MVTTSGQAGDGYSGLRDRRLVSWLAGEFVSHFGDQFFIIAISVTATQAGGPGALALVLSVGMLPRLLLMLPGGALVDRLDPRRVMIWSDVVRTVLAAGITLYTAIARPNVTVLLVAMLLFSVIGSAFEPATNAIPVYAVRTEDLVRLQGIRTTLSRIAIIAGAPAGGVIVGFGGASLAFGLDAASFLLGAIAVAALRMRKTALSPANAEETTKSSLLRETLDGLRYTIHRPLLLVVVLVLAGMEFSVTGPVSVGLPALTLERGWGPSGLGLILGFFGFGAMIGPLTISVIGNRLGRVGGWTLIVAAAGCLLLAVIATTPELVVACVAAACMGAAINFLSAVFIPLLQTNAEPAYVGRVMSTLSFGFTGLAPLSMAVTGILMEVLGSTVTIVSGASVAALVGLSGLASRHLRNASVASGDHAKKPSKETQLETRRGVGPQEG
ncbi:MFS transporter [Streptosporangium saharense]|uniref:MFS transporter n=1 Tax=Streptosporangium saharense TaxID=1706840 RepID=UPI0036761646